MREAILFEEPDRPRKLTRFFILLILAAVIATFGLLADSVATVIGAMIVAPLMLHISNVYALRMAGVIMISLGTIWMRTGLMPRWLAWVTFSRALVLLLVVSFNPWLTLVYPA